MEQLGKVIEWNDDRGFGFIALLDSPTTRLFFHIRNYEQAGRRPETGELVRFKLGKSQDGRPHAEFVQRAVQPKRASRPEPPTNRHTSELPTSIATLLIVAFATTIGWAVHTGRLPILVAFLLAFLSGIAYIAYALDKDAAQHGRWRIQESTLHLLELLGGWPGALLAQRILRHKTRKASYRIGFWLAVAINCMALGWWIWHHPFTSS